MNVMSVVEELLCLSVLYLFVCLFFWWLLLPSRLLSLPSSTTSQTPPPRSILRTTRHLWEIKHSHFGSRVLQQKSFVLQFWPKSPVVVACLLIPLFFFFWWLLLASPLPSLPSTTTSQIDISPPPTIPHTTRHLWETKHSRFGSRVLQQKIFVWQFCPKCVCLLLSVGKIALLVCWGSVVCVCSVSLISGQIQMLQNPPKTSKNTEIHK